MCSLVDPVRWERDDDPKPGSRQNLTRPAHPVPGPEPPSLSAEHWRGNHLAEFRWQLELYRLLVDPVFRGGGVPRGDGRPVILMPGFGAGDQTLLVLAAWLKRIGYRPSTCGFVTNTGCSDRALDRVERRLHSAHLRFGRRVALIGHSRGGHYARALGHRHPELVSHAISLGAGLRQLLAVSSGRARAPGCLTEACSCGFGRDFAASFPEDQVRLTSIYSRGDGVVRWDSAIVPYAECVEVTGSHVGLVFNRKAYAAIATALAQPELPAFSPVGTQASKSR
jgi:pimeloyl-ACP methyl ester carboxylesterase